jgi:amino acid adenylation domain-containing protein
VYGDDSLASLFLKAATSHPDALALTSSRANLTYRDLLSRAVCLAQVLRQHGATRGTLVGIWLSRSVESVVAVLGTLLCGAAYVPIDPTYPTQRQQFLVDDSQLSLVVTSRQAGMPAVALGSATVVDIDTLAGQTLTADQVAAFVPTRTMAADLLYVLYTSGSTGRPNGVCGPNGPTLNRLRWGFEALPFDPSGQEVIAHRSSLNFVDSVAELFSGLISGIPTALLYPEETSDLGRMIATLRLLQVTRLTVVPSVLAALLRAVPKLSTVLPKLKLWTCSGEELPASLLQQFRASFPSATLVNIYGSTEVTADVTYALFAPGQQLPTERVPIGASMASAELLILDDHMQPVPDGQSGELYVGGPVLSAGYLRRPQEQARRFVTDPRRADAKLFRTGDRVRRGSDGQLYYLGRQDNQIKLRGVRIELEEVERILLAATEGLSGLAVVVVGNPSEPNSRHLCAFYTPPDYEVLKLRSAVEHSLPASMRPTEFVAMTSLPLLPNGKLDRPTLAQERKRPVRVLSPEQLPQTQTEQRLSSLYAQVLGTQSIARQDTFATLGGDSLALAELLAKLDGQFPRHVFEGGQLQQTEIMQLAEWIDCDTMPSVADSLSGVTLLPLSPQVVREEVMLRLASAVDLEREPLTAAAQLTYEDELPYVKPIVAAGLYEGLSVVARSEATGHLVGFCLAHDFCTPAGVSLEESAPRLKPVVKLLTELEEDYVRTFGQPVAGEVVQLSMTGTLSEVTGYEIARQLEQYTLKTSRARGYRRAVTICTHRVTAILAERAGFVRCVARDYSTYEYEGQRVFASLADIHREVILFVKELS